MTHKITISRELVESAIDQLKSSQHDYYVQDTQDVINSLEEELKLEL